MAHTRRRLMLSMALLSVIIGATLAPLTAAARGVGRNPNYAGPVELAAQVTCRAGGGIDVTFTITNNSNETIKIDEDFRLTLTVQRGFGRGSEQTFITFVFPAPGFDTIPPGESRTFIVPIGDGMEGAPGSNLQGAQLRLVADVWLIGHERPVTARFNFTGC